MSDFSSLANVPRRYNESDGANLSALGQGEPTGRTVVGQDPYPTSKKPRPIQIHLLDHGFNVTVGCQNFAVETVDALIHRLSVYLKAPAEQEAKWLSGEWKW